MFPFLQKTMLGDLASQIVMQFLIETRGYNAKEATIQAMSDVTSAVIATTLVLLGIFVPVGFMSGITGRIYQQFSVTLSAAVVFSTVCALTLSPALCAVLMRPSDPSRRKAALFRLVDTLLARLRGGYLHVSFALAARSAVLVPVVAAVALWAAHLAKTLPAAFIPHEDRGMVMVDANLPEGAVRAMTMQAASEWGHMGVRVNAIADRKSVV